MGELSAQLLVATVGQFFGIRVLYTLIGFGVFTCGIWSRVSRKDRKQSEAVSERQDGIFSPGEVV